MKDTPSMIHYLMAFAVVFAVFISFGNVLAQQAQNNAAPGGANTPVQEKVRGGKLISPNEIPSLFFTYWQHRAIVDAKNSRGSVRPPTQEELEAIERGEDLVDPGPRDITLGGIVFADKNDWTIWINGQRIQPNAIPKEILDLRVYEDYVELKWLDEYTKQIFPLRLRAHQRFNLDTRMFLPG